MVYQHLSVSKCIPQFSSVAQSCLTLRPCGLQHARLPSPSPTPGACSNSCPSSQWCHPTISSTVVPFSSRLQSFPASGFFPVNQLFSSGGQSTGFSFSISLSNEYSGLVSFRIDCLDLLAVQGTLKRLLQHQMWQHMATPNVFLGIYKFLSLRNIFLYQTGNNPSEYSLTLMLNSFTHAHLLKWQCVKK